MRKKQRNFGSESTTCRRVRKKNMRKRIKVEGVLALFQEAKSLFDRGGREITINM